MRSADRSGGQLHQIGYRGQYPLAALAAAARAALRPLGPTGLALRPVEVDRSTQTHPKVTMGHPNPPQGLCFLCRDLHSSLLVLVYTCQFKKQWCHWPDQASRLISDFKLVFTYCKYIVPSIHSIEITKLLLNQHTTKKFILIIVAYFLYSKVHYQSQR